MRGPRTSSPATIWRILPSSPSKQSSPPAATPVKTPCSARPLSSTTTRSPTYASRSVARRHQASNARFRKEPYIAESRSRSASRSLVLLTAWPNSIDTLVAPSGRSFDLIFTLRPTPRIRTGGPDEAAETDARMPQTLWSLMRRSFGHLIRGRRPVIASTASATQAAVSRASGVNSEGARCGRSSTESRSDVPDGACQPRPARPRPADWYSATSVVPSGAPARASTRSSCIVLETTSRRISGRPRTGAAWDVSSVTVSTGGGPRTATVLVSTVPFSSLRLTTWLSVGQRRRGRHLGEPQPPDAMPLDGEDLDADPFGGEDVALHRQALHVLVDEPAEGSEVIVLLETKLQRVPDILDRQAAVRQQDVRGDKLEERALRVVLILDLADDLFEDVLDRDQPGRAAVLVGDDGDVDVLPLELCEHVAQALRLRHDDGRTDQVEQWDAAGTADYEPQQVFGVEDAEHVV